MDILRALCFFASGVNATVAFLWFMIFGDIAWLSVATAIIPFWIAKTTTRIA